jgi:cellulose 1,4-beta-cellobiosidase
MLSLLAFALLAVATYAQGNPFAGKEFYVQETYVAEVQSTINMYPNDAAKLKAAQEVSVFYWIDSISRIQNITVVLEGAKKQMQQDNKDVLVQFIIYDVPDRDCSALASNGEIICADNACAAGIQRYETQYIDPIVKIFSGYPDLTIIALIEPDSLPNLATNMNVQKCVQAQTAYKTCISYAIRQLATLKNVHQYVDAAHGGWLGWPDNMQKFVPIISEVLQGAGGPQTIRGFASNTANYQPLMSITSTMDYCHLESEYNQCINEAKYIQYMDQMMRQGGITGMYYITDTSRNGVPDARTDQTQPCSQWCNIRGTGLHFKPTTETSSTGLSIIDAFVWAKVPGESDGTSNSSASNFDAHCASDESFQPAPQAGVWFPQFFKMLADAAVY